jgi:hypothetical protein
MVSSSQIKEQLARFLDNQISLDEFEDWFVQNTWNIHLSGSVSAESLTFAVEESLSEYSSQHIGEPILRQELSLILGAENKVLNIVDSPQIVYSFRYSSPLALLPVRA